MTKDEALKLALEALEGVVYAEHNVQPAITAIKAALAQQDAEDHLQAVADFGQEQSHC